MNSTYYNKKKKFYPHRISQHYSHVMDAILEYIDKKYNITFDDNYLDDLCKNGHLIVTDGYRCFYTRHNYLFKIYSRLYLNGSSKHITTLMPKGTQKHKDFVKDVKNFTDDLHKKIKDQELLIKNNIRSTIIKQIEDEKNAFYDDMMEKIDGPRKKYYDELYKKINDTYLNDYNNAYLKDYINSLPVDDQKNNIPKCIELHLKKHIRIGTSLYDMKSYKNESKIVSIKKNQDIESRKINIFVKSIKTGLIEPRFVEKLVIDNAVIMANRII